MPRQKNKKPSLLDVPESVEKEFIVDYFNKTSGNAGLKVTRVQRVENSRIQRRFMNELKIIREKNPNLRLDQMIRILWHGSRTTSPEMIALSETGLDMRYANPGGAFGSGTYFADNA